MTDKRNLLETVLNTSQVDFRINRKHWTRFLNIYNILICGDASVLVEISFEFDKYFWHTTTTHVDFIINTEHWTRFLKVCKIWKSGGVFVLVVNSFEFDKHWIGSNSKRTIWRRDKQSKIFEKVRLLLYTVTGKSVSSV